MQVDEHVDGARVEVTRSRLSCGSPARHTWTPLMATSMPYGSNAAPVVPTAARTRPQLGSLPNTAALKRLLRATARPTSTASSSEAACTTSMAMTWEAPSAAACSCSARSAHTAVSAAWNAYASGTTPDAPLARSVTWSLADMQPSESRRSNVTRVDSRRAASSAAESRSASVVITTSIVASPGASLPAPLAMPPTVHPSSEDRTDCFGFVSVVMMARAASSPPPSASATATRATPSSSFSSGSCSPMRPVLQTSTSPLETSSARPTASALACVTWKPGDPV